VPKRVGLYGGFAGDELALGEQDPPSHPTVLSGDLAGNDDLDSLATFNDNSYQILALTRNTTLNGFELSGGFAAKTLEDGAAGAALKLALPAYEPSQVEIRRCVFRSNLAHFSGNMDENDGGAAVQINGGVGVVFEDCLFEENYSSDPIDPDDVIYGGALGAFHADLEMIGCAFRDNAVSGSDSRGGGVAAVGGTLRLYGCTFVGNAAGKSGGGLLASGSLDMRDCRLFGNYASLGGGMFATGALQMSNSVLSGNRALDFGAGIYFGPVGVPDGILHCTITRNHAYGAGAGIFSASPIPVPLLNSIVRDNSAANENDDLATQLFALAAPFDVSYSCVQGIAETKGNIDQDPMFFDPEGADGWEGTEDDDLRLAPCSPAVDAGNSEILPDSLTADLDGLARAVDVDESFAPDTGLGFPVADMGAYEHPMAGDLDGNDSVDVVDVQCAILTMWWHYYGAVGPPPDCVLQSAYADMDGNGGIDLIDVYRIIYLMHGYKPGC